jgi:membrane associated rhomboid family serine protease
MLRGLRVVGGRVSGGRSLGPKTPLLFSRGGQSIQKTAFSSWRGSSSSYDSNFVLYAVIGANLAVFGGFEVIDYGFMRDNFTSSWRNLLQGRIWTVVTSAFAHKEIWHLAINMFVLYQFGGTVRF